MLPAIIALSLHNGAIIGYLLGRQTDELDFRADAPTVRTLGYNVDAAISELRLDTAALLLIGVAALSITADALSRGLRRSLRIDKLPTRFSTVSGPYSALAR
jgi:phosphonate transport system permease protein